MLWGYGFDMQLQKFKYFPKAINFSHRTIPSTGEGSYWPFLVLHMDEQICMYFCIQFVQKTLHYWFYSMNWKVVELIILYFLTSDVKIEFCCFFLADLRKRARQLENEIDLKLVSFSKLGTNYSSHRDDVNRWYFVVAWILVSMWTKNSE